MSDNLSLSLAITSFNIRYKFRSSFVRLYLFITLSFFRNTSKNEALDAKNFAVFFLKVLCDATSKLLLFGAWMYTFNHWSLSTNLIVTFYYGMMSLLLIVNIGFSVKNKEKFGSFQNIIGTKVLVIFRFCIVRLYLYV